METEDQSKNADIGRPIIPVSEYFLQFRTAQKTRELGGLPFMYVVVHYLG